MFDLRYHVASLAAVFLALIIGILVGVGISERPRRQREDKFLKDEVASLAAPAGQRSEPQSTDSSSERAAAQTSSRDVSGADRATG